MVRQTKPDILPICTSKGRLCCFTTHGTPVARKPFAMRARKRKRLQPAAIPLLRPLVGTDQRTRDLQRFVVAFDNKHARQIESQLRALRAPTLIVWGTDDVYSPVKSAHRARRNDPGSKTAGRVGGRPHLLSGGAGRGIQPAAARSPARRINRLRSEQGAFAGSRPIRRHQWRMGGSRSACHAHEASELPDVLTAFASAVAARPWVRSSTALNVRYRDRAICCWTAWLRSTAVGGGCWQWRPWPYGALERTGSSRP